MANPSAIFGLSLGAKSGVYSGVGFDDGAEEHGARSTPRLAKSFRKSQRLGWRRGAGRADGGTANGIAGELERRRRKAVAPHLPISPSPHLPCSSAHLRQPPRARAAAIFLTIGAAEAVRAGEAAGEGDFLHGLLGRREHRVGMFEPEAAEHRARRFAETGAELADEMLAADAAFGGRGLQVHRRAEVIPQIVIPELD